MARAPRVWTQDEIDAEMLSHSDADDDDTEMQAGEDCGRWSNGRLGQQCSKAGSEECDWDCPYS